METRVVQNRLTREWRGTFVKNNIRAQVFLEHFPTLLFASGSQSGERYITGSDLFRLRHLRYKYMSDITVGKMVRFASFQRFSPQTLECGTLVALKVPGAVRTRGLAMNVFLLSQAALQSHALPLSYKNIAILRSSDIIMLGANLSQEQATVNNETSGLCLELRKFGEGSYGNRVVVKLNVPTSAPISKNNTSILPKPVSSVRLSFSLSFLDAV